jgi:hypothetical protein
MILCICAQVLICSVGQPKPAGALGLEHTLRGPTDPEWPLVFPLQPEVMFVQDRKVKKSGSSAGLYGP